MKLLFTLILTLLLSGCGPLGSPKMNGSRQRYTCSVISTCIHAARGNVFRFKLADGKTVIVENSSTDGLTIWEPKKGQ